MTDSMDPMAADVPADSAPVSGVPTAPLEKPVNYFDRYDAESDASEPGLLERARLNAKNSYYRGTLAGASELTGLAHVYKLDDTDVSPDQKAWRQEQRDKYDGIVGDLARYDSIRPWGTTTEGAAALAGQLTGGMASPESLVGWGATGANLAIRTAKAAVQQGFITGAIDPIVQYLDIGGGVRKSYDPLQTATSFGVGAIIGGGLHIGGELVSSAHIKKTTAELGKDDPQFKAADDVVETAPVAETAPPEKIAAVESSDTIPPIAGETFKDYVARSGVEMDFKVARDQQPPEVQKIMEAWDAAGGYRTNEQTIDPGNVAVDQSAPVAENRVNQSQAPQEGGSTSPEARIETPFAETRGQGVQYHGTSLPDLVPSSDHYSSKNYYGQGFYTTDAVDIAHGYSKRGAKTTGERNIYVAEPNRALNIYDAEKPIEPDLHNLLKPAKEDYSDLGSVMDSALNEEPKNLRELYDNIREIGTGEGLSADTIQEMFDAINYSMRELGYDGLSHKGGLRTGKEPHNVTIYFDPEKDLTVKKQSFDAFRQQPLPVKEAAAIPPTPRTPEQSALIAKRDAITSELAAIPEGSDLAIAKRTAGGGTLPMERQRPSAGKMTDEDGLTGTKVAVIPENTSPEQAGAIKSLQQQSIALADALDIPLRQGRIKNKNALGTFNTGSGVVRVREVPDFEAVAHEAGHAIEYKIGKDMTDLTNKYGAELAPLVSNAAAYDPSVHVKEGFAEFIRRYIGNPAHAEQVAPGFTGAFRDFMAKRYPQVMQILDDASASYRAYIEAPSVDAVGAVVRSRSEEAHGWKKVVQSIKEDGFASTVKTVVQNVYRGLLDDKAPVALAVRDLAKSIRDEHGALVDLKAADNPEVLIRLFARSHQSAVRDMMDGVRGYHSIEPSGPSLSDALAHATGSPTVWGKWDPDKKAMFSDFMVARRAALLWDKFKAGDLANPPVAFSKADAVVAMAELERANPRFREASNMVHEWTRELLRKQYEGGLIPADLFDKLSKEEFYVPFMRDLSDKPNAGGGGKTGSSDGPGMTDTVKRMKGSSRDIKDPIESLMTQAFLVNRTLAHNDIIKSFVRLSEQAGIEGGKFVEKIPAHEGRGYNFDMAQSIERLAKERGIDPDDAKVLTSALTDVFGEDPIVGSFFRMEPAGKRGEPIVFYKEAGQMKAARFMSGEEGHALYETLTALPTPLTDAWSQMIAATTSTLRAGITTNPMFALTNYIRDQFAVAILRSDYIPIVSGMKGLKQEVTQGESAILYGYGGGVSGGASIAPLEQAIENDVNALAKKGYLVNRLTSFKGVMELAGITEAGTRNSVFGKVFEAKKAQGLNDYEAMIEAAFSAQDVLDFSRHGSHTLMIRKYIPFINAWAQGLDKARRVMFEPVITKLHNDQAFATDPQEFNNAMLSITKLFGVGGVLGAGWAALNAEKDGYRDASPVIKGTHVVIPIGNKILLVPKPFELGIGFTAGEYAYQALAQQDPRAASQFATAAWDSLTSGNPLTDIPLVKQYFELKSGKNLFTGRDIVPGSLQRLAPEMQYTNNTSSVAKWLGAKIGVSPIKVDYAIGSTFGLWGRDIMALSSGVDPDKPAQSWEDRVFVRRLLKDPSRTSDVTTKFWDYMGQTTGKYNQNVATYDDLVKKFRDDDAKQFMNKLPDAQRAFLIMKSAADEDGKPAFKADEKRLHPLQRAYDAVTVLNGLRRELTDNTFQTYEGGKQQKLSPDLRRDLIENVRELAQMEMRNSLVILKEPGYANRQLFNVNDTMDKIMAIDPTVGNEIATRYATAKIYKTDAVAKAFPELQSTLLHDGSEADLGNLAADVGADGYQFEGDRVRKPQKRRVRIPATISP